MPPTNGDDSEVGVRIGIREIYDHVHTLVRSVDLVSRQIETLTTNVTTATTHANGLAERVRILEMQKVVTPASMWTAITVLTGVAGALVAVIALMMQG